tara:strand:- start:210 stop:590 length:381 start_codon:yes stop_codon:yes gene_type:complete
MELHKLNLYSNIFITLIKYFFKKHLMSFKKLIQPTESNKKNLQNISANKIIYSANKVFKKMRINSCLLKSLIVRKILSDYGHESFLVIAIKNERSNFSSHCWLDLKEHGLTYNKEDFKDFKIISKN